MECREAGNQVGFLFQIKILAVMLASPDRSSVHFPLVDKFLRQKKHLKCGDFLQKYCKFVAAASFPPGKEALDMRTTKVVVYP